MRPQRRARMPGSTARAHRKAPFRFTASVRSNSSSVSSSRSRGIATPALLTSTSTGPSSPSAERTISTTARVSDTSAAMARARRPFARTASAVSSAFRTRSRQFTTTSAPVPASASAIARPMPRDAPVTSAVRPVRSAHASMDQRSVTTASGHETPPSERRRVGCRDRRNGHGWAVLAPPGPTAKSWTGGATMTDSSLNRRMTVRLGDAVAFAQIGIVGRDRQIEL